MAEDYTRAIKELQRLLNDWDPIGVFGDDSDWPDDEYECMYYPLLGRLRRGESAREIADYLLDDLTNHFGLSEAGYPIEFAERLVAWWTQRS